MPDAFISCAAYKSNHPEIDSDGTSYELNQVGNYAQRINRISCSQKKIEDNT